MQHPFYSIHVFFRLLKCFAWFAGKMCSCYIILYIFSPSDRKVAQKRCLRILKALSRTADKFYQLGKSCVTHYSLRLPDTFPAYSLSLKLCRNQQEEGLSLRLLLCSGSVLAPHLSSLAIKCQVSFLSPLHV